MGVVKEAIAGLAVRGTVTHERWPLAKPLKISRGTLTHTDLVVVSLAAGGFNGRGECAPSTHYGESAATVIAEAESLVEALGQGQDWALLHDASPAGAARNAVDCAIWDLRAKCSRTPVWKLAGVRRPRPCLEVMTIGLDAPPSMAKAARTAADGFRILKLKLGGDDDMACIDAVARAVPGIRLIADANEGWRRHELPDLLAACVKGGVEMIEQPLPRSDDDELENIGRSIPVCADESCRTRADLEAVSGRYDLINIKLDKSGGLTEALALAREAQQRGLGLMIGCRQGTSLALAPAMLLARLCAYVDLDSPLFIGRDRSPSVSYRNALIHPPAAGLWG